MLPGADVVKFPLSDADVVITGDGRSDVQTMMGKVPCGVRKRCMRAGVPTWLLSGAIEDATHALSDHFGLMRGIKENESRSLRQLLQPEVAKANIVNTVKGLMESGEP